MAWKARGPVLPAAAFPALFVFYFAVGRYSSELGPQYHIFSLPFAALLIGIGIDGAAKWLRRRLAPRALREVLAVMTVVLLGAQSLMIFSASFRDTSGVYGACGAQLDQVSQPGDLVVIGTTSLAIDRGTPNNYQEPTIFYLADRKGWSLPADRYSSALLREHVAQGAKYFVNYDPSLVPAGSEIAGWLAADTIQVRSAAADGCDIWMLRPAGPA